MYHHSCRNDYINQAEKGKIPMTLKGMSTDVFDRFMLMNLNS